ncbi:MAG: DUF1003 domain-containing protein [Ruminococcus sp.]|nr:DUF1003 domain-containing protein [Ruminococcus sp.]MDD7344501.1 DUF1003 domain-containing protein [Ruminococcus sp.]MDY4909453.1 DUF1003 domain-containing protein [Candidatus Fimenecus sp.]MDY6059523.1 DUF1003 domain-containing protein [Candidatus Fimenecus sp.]
MTHYQLLGKILKDVREDMSDDELTELLLENKISVSDNKKITFGQRASDKLAEFAGSWFFIIAFTLFLIIWVLINVYFLKNPFDPYPFIMLNLVLSCVAAIQAPLIMMSQKRQEQKDRERAEDDFKINLKCEIILENLHRKLDELLEYERKR